MTAILSPELPSQPSALRAAITAAWARDEAEHVRELLEQARLPDADRAAIRDTAADLVRRVRARAADQGVVDGLVDGSGAVADSAGQVFRQMQTGKVQQYGAIFFAATVVLAGVFIVVI